MIRARASSSLIAYGGLGLGLAIGAVALFWNLTKSSLYIDEAFSLHIASYPLPAMLQLIVHNDAHPPLFYLFSHYLIMLVHVPAERYRLFTAPCGLITIVATWAIARRILGDAGAAVAALLTAAAPGLLDADRVYRMYAPLAMLSMLSWWSLLCALDEGRRRPAIVWSMYAVCAVALPYVHYLGALTVAAQCCYAAVDARRRWPVLAAGGLAVAAFVPWIAAVGIQYAHGGLAAGPDFDLRLAPVESVLAGIPLAWMGQASFVVGADVVILAVLVIGAWLARSTPLPFMLMALALQILLTAVLHKPLLFPRYLHEYVPVFALCAAAVIAALAATRARVAAVALAAIVLTTFAICDADMILDPLYQRTDWYLVNNHVATLERRTDAMLFVQGFPVLVVGTYPAFAAHDQAAPASAQMLPDARAWIIAHTHDRIWYVENQYWYADPARVLLRDLARDRRVLDRWAEPRADAADAVTVILFDSVSPREPSGNREQGHGRP
ncbi:MAG TPA: glycosyltransferase family 39 protein [Candidatus Eremiobacteraceae bacterium]|nr:glycosyltransferase family 39 protein [Candidatus Eremiobacteraceae bacterium]